MSERVDHIAPAGPNAAHPRVSVVIRSLGRLASLIELLENVLAQNHDSFEVVVIEQTPDPDAADWSRIEELARDDRLRLLRHPPLGGPAARNAGVLQARGELIILIDDDDLPVGVEWISAHEQAYVDPRLVGLTGRHVHAVGEKYPYLQFMRPFIRRRCMRYSFIKTAYTYARFNEDVDGVEWLHGTNSSFRTELLARARLWDTTVTTQDEHSFAFKLHKVLRPGEYLAFRTAPVIVRRLHIPGGMDKRRVAMDSELASHLAFVFRIVRTYHPLRFRLAFPLYLLWSVWRTIAWVWGDARPRTTVKNRTYESLRALALVVPAAVREYRRSPPPSESV